MYTTPPRLLPAPHVHHSTTSTPCPTCPPLPSIYLQMTHLTCLSSLSITLDYTRHLLRLSKILLQFMFPLFYPSPSILSLLPFSLHSLSSTLLPPFPLFYPSSSIPSLLPFSLHSLSFTLLPPFRLPCSPLADPPEISFAVGYIEIVGTPLVHSAFLHLSKPANTRFLVQVVHGTYTPPQCTTHNISTQCTHRATNTHTEPHSIHTSINPSIATDCRTFGPVGLCQLHTVQR